MIAYLSGKLIYQSAFLKKDNFVVLDCNGVGYKVFVADKILNGARVGETMILHVYTQVAETALDLYGFATREELDFFELLLTISGIGPRSAMDILRKAKIEDLVKGVESGDFQLLAKVSGIGPKTAEKIVIGLKDKLTGGYTVESGGWNNDFGDALEALISLGYNSTQARDALSRCQATDAGEKIKEALKILGKK
ncbi:MAG: Holliday junction ATP-dependent DNA helicase RuvA [Parcubacteria group bacterium ADurb.Bin326]|nr:MAG: Holliday junction ATP-dependent DNA helicase RuvA [Parcubacteria group bacterium ADurb.Bin326]